MPTNDDSINYSGPSKDWTPLSGDNFDVLSTRRKIKEATYSNIDALRLNLDAVIAETTDTIVESEKILRDFNLSIPLDSALEKAQEAEWPAELGAPKDYVTFSQQKTMNLRNTRGSNYVYKEYNNAVRGAWGTTAADVTTITGNIRAEAGRIKNFLDNYIIQESNDSSQQRAIELFQDWTVKAIESSGHFRYLIAAKDKAQEYYPKSELDKTTPSQARNFQAVLQVQLNESAADTDKLQEDLGKHLGGNANLFYDSYLGPALKFRREISSTITQEPNDGKMAREMHDASRTLDDNTVSMLSDLMKRNEIYATKAGRLAARINETDMRRKAIQDLASRGSMPINPFVPHIQVSGELDYFEVEYEGWIDEIEEAATPNYTNQAYVTTTSNRFKSPHNQLADREIDEAHPQYLLKDGGTITGDISVGDGVKIDGVGLAAHAHTGFDGTGLIDGLSIAPGTLPTSAFSVDDDSDGISDFRFVLYTSITSASGNTTYDATVAWEGDDDSQFEIQITRLP